MSVELLDPGALQVERLPSGRRKLLRPLRLRIDGRVLEVPEGFVTDFSSWPRFLPGPNFSRVDLAGVCHDWLFREGMWDGEPVTFLDANRVWYKVARAGSKQARASWAWAWVGRIGLAAFSVPVWWRYRLAQRGV